jgi:hypothetical protein
MPFHGTWIPLLGSLFVIAALAPLAALLPDPASASTPCKRFSLRIPTHRVSANGWIRVRGRSCDQSARRHRVRFKIRQAGHWRLTGSARTRPGGRFSKRVHLHAVAGHKVVRLQATASARKSRTVRIHVIEPGCTVGPPGSLGVTVGGCRVLASDTATGSNPRNFWGSVECGRSLGSPDPSRQQDIASGGDTHLTATGAAQGDSNYRRLTVEDSDDYYGERCELGKNDHRTGPTTFYHEGQRRATFVSLRLPSNFPLNADSWQTVMQMKQAQPSHDDGPGPPILFMGAYEGRWQVEGVNGDFWTFPAQPGVWTRFGFDVFYSQDQSRGWLQVSADLNGDGDFDDPGERSPVIHAATLATEIAAPGSSGDGLAPGASIPSHLRTGIYHDSSISCPAPSGCSIEVDNVQVVAL